MALGINSVSIKTTESTRLQQVFEKINLYRVSAGTQRPVCHRELMSSGPYDLLGLEYAVQEPTRTRARIQSILQKIKEHNKAQASESAYYFDNSPYAQTCIHKNKTRILKQD